MLASTSPLGADFSMSGLATADRIYTDTPSIKDRQVGGGGMLGEVDRYCKWIIVKLVW